MILPEPQPPIEQILKSDSFKQRIYVRNAMYAAERVLPPHLAKLVISEFESAIALTDMFGASPLVLRAAANVLEMAREHAERAPAALDKRASVQPSAREFDVAR